MRITRTDNAVTGIEPFLGKIRETQTSAEITTPSTATTWRERVRSVRTWRWS
jgi:hypothetical protein